MGHRGFVDILPLAAMIFPASLAHALKLKW
jgi:hypothetical protein